MITKESINKRIEKLEKDKSLLVRDIKNKRRIHPAIKQIEGRVLELEYLKCLVEKDDILKSIKKGLMK